jgi:hypothetical protein
LTENDEFNPWEHMKWELDLECMEFIISAFESYNKYAESNWLWPEDIEEISTCLKSNEVLSAAAKKRWIDFAHLVTHSQLQVNMVLSLVSMLVLSFRDGYLPEA